MTTPIKSKRRLTLKQQGFVKDYIETKNATEAAARNYDTDDRAVAAAIAGENLQKPAIQAELETIKAQYRADAYKVYEIQKQILYKVSGGRDLQLANKIADKIQDRAGLAPVSKNESKHMTAKFVITRGIEAGTVDDTKSTTNDAHIAL